MIFSISSIVGSIELTAHSKLLLKTFILDSLPQIQEVHQSLVAKTALITGGMQVILVVGVLPRIKRYNILSIFSSPIMFLSSNSFC